MKKLFSILLSGTMALSLFASAFAAEPVNQDGISNINEAAVSGDTIEKSTLGYEIISGTIVKSEEHGVLINTEKEGNVKLNIDSAILRGDDIMEAKEGSRITAIVSPIRTRSLPPIANAYAVVVSELTAIKEVNVAKVEETKDGINFWSEDGMDIIVTTNETPVTPYKTKNIMKVMDINEGDTIYVLSDISTMSIPAQVIANEIIVFADELSDNSEETENKNEAAPLEPALSPEKFLNGREDGLALDSNVTRAEALTMVLRADGKEDEALNFESVMPEFQTISGTIVSVEENGVLIETAEEGTVKVNVEPSLLRGTALNEAKEGNRFSAIVSPIRTMSLPPIANAYAAVISEITSIKPIEVTKVEKGENGISIYSDDETEIITASGETVVTPYRTRNIMTVDDISEGDKIFVLSDIMTASLPARVLATEIIVFENEFDESDVIYEDTKGHWAENIIGYSIVNGYTSPAEDGTFDPEEEITGKEFASIVLLNMGVSDVSDENVYELAKENGILVDEDVENAVKDNSKITRLEAAKLCTAVR